MKYETVNEGPRWKTKSLSGLALLVVAMLHCHVAFGQGKALDALLRKDQEPERWLARLKDLDPISNDACHKLIRQSPHSSAKEFGITNLRFHTKDERIVESLVVVMRDASLSTSVRMLAAEKLLEGSNSTRAVRRQVVSWLKDQDSDDQIVAYAIERLGEIGMDGEVIELLPGFLGRGSTQHAHLAFRVLAKRQRQSQHPESWGSLPSFASNALDESSQIAKAIHADELAKFLKGPTPTYLQIEALRRLVETNPSDRHTLLNVLQQIGGNDHYLSQKAVGELGKIDFSNVDVAECLGNRLPGLAPRVQSLVLKALENSAVNSKIVTKAILPLLESFSGVTDHFLVAQCLTTISRCETAEGDIQERLVSLLTEDCRLYADRTPREKVWLRSWIFSTLAKIGVPDSAFPFLLDAIVNAEEFSHAIHCGAAIRAAGEMRAPPPSLVPHLVETYTKTFSLNEFSLDRYSSDFPGDESTNVQLEILRVLGRMGATSTVEGLLSGDQGERSLGESPVQDDQNRNGESSWRTAWIDHDERKDLAQLRLRVVAQDGESILLKDLLDRPVALTFFYTRCTNARKCCSAIGRMSRLNRRLLDEGLNARILAATFEPEHDTPETLKAFGQDMGVSFSDRMKMLRFSPEDQQAVVGLFGVPVSYHRGFVASHGVLLLLIDRDGRVARRYHTVLWDNEEVVRDLRRLVDEETSS